MGMNSFLRRSSGHDLVAEYDEARALGNLSRCPRAPRGIHGASRVVRVDDDDRARLLGDERLDVFRIRNEVVLRPAGIVNDLAAVQRGGRGPQRIVRDSGPAPRRPRSSSARARGR